VLLQIENWMENSLMNLFNAYILFLSDIFKVYKGMYNEWPFFYCGVGVKERERSEGLKILRLTSALTIHTHKFDMSQQVQDSNALTFRFFAGTINIR